MAKNITKAEKIKSILSTLQTDTPDVEAVFLSNLQGLTIASITPNMAQEADVSAKAAFSFATGEKFLEALQRGQLKKVLIHGDSGNIVIVAAGEKSVLVVLAKEDAKLGMIFIDAENAAQEIGKIFSGAS